LNKKYIQENFEDTFLDNELYNDLYDEEFVNLYEIIYRDYSDIEYDLKVVYSKIMDNMNGINTNEKNIYFLVCGSGVGKLCYKIKENYNVMGVDISTNMLKKSEELYPNIKFIRGNICKKNIFPKNKFSHIYFDERTLYYNEKENMKNIIENIFDWLIEDGYFIIQIYDPLKLQLAARYYSSKYIDNKGNIHGLTYLNDFSHDCFYIQDKIDKEIYYYYDKIIFDSGHKRIKKTKFIIPNKEYIYDILLKSGFEIIYIEKIRLQIVGGYDLCICKKKKKRMTVSDLEMKKIKLLL
jgi:predicted TPR repeat methyltransferase